MSRTAEKLRPAVPKVLTALGMTMLAFLLSAVLMVPFSFSASAFLSNPEKSDFAITDFYSIVADSRPVRSIDDEIVIVNLKGLDREGIAEVLELMPLLDPAAVGLDVAFVEPRENDSRLINAISACPRLVMPVSLIHNPSDNDFSLGEISFFAASSAVGVPLGATNLPAKYAKSTIREFQTSFPLSSPITTHSDSIPSFAAAVAAIARPELAEQLFRRGRSVEMINYPSRSFRVFKPEEIADNAHLIAGKIILLGDTDDLSDMHATPVTSTMPGVMIHAYALATIIHENYLDSFSPLQDKALAFMLCFLVVLTGLLLPVKVKGLTMRIMQLLMLYLVVRLGYTLFLDHNLVIDFSYSLLMLAFGLFAADIWTGTTTAAVYIRKQLPSVLRRLHHIPQPEPKT